MIIQVNEKFHIQNEKKKDEQSQIFTVLPPTWSNSKIQQEFKFWNYVVWTSKRFVVKKGNLLKPICKSGKVLPQLQLQGWNDLMYLLVIVIVIVYLFHRSYSAKRATECRTRQALTQMARSSNFKNSWYFDEQISENFLGFSEFGRGTAKKLC
jgi:hypothetical protein